MKYLALLLVLHFVVVINGELPNEIKKKRSFSIFSVVQFQNNVCYLGTTTASSTTTRGTCFTSSECSSNGGSGTGSCASGFGVCCVFTVSTCGSTVSKNTTYIQNPGFPSAFTTVTTACTYTISSTSDICQIRLDFDNLVLGNPTSGVCATGDRISFSSPSGTPSPAGSAASPPTLCGTLTGSHMYIETARASPTGATLTIANAGTATTTPARTWKIRVTQIECGNPSRAPTDCLQYYTGVSQAITSYNFQAGATTGNFLSGLNYNACIRQEEGYCTIQYSLSDVTAPTVAFSVDSTTAPTTAARITQGTCTIAGVTISMTSVTTTGDTFCGTIFSDTVGSTRSGIVTSSVTPFVVGVYSVSTAVTGVGFSLNYMQVAC